MRALDNNGSDREKNVAESRDNGIRRKAAVVAVVAKKGGVGKTTMALSLAVQALQFERRDAGIFPAWEPPPGLVALVDRDPQGSLTRWSNLRMEGGWGDGGPVLEDGVAPGGLGRALDDIGEAGTRLVFVDCPPGYYATYMEEAIMEADLVLIPTGAGPQDMWAVEEMIEVAEAHGKPYMVFLSNVGFRQQMTGRAVTALRERGVLLRPVVHRRVGIAEPLASGRSVSEVRPRGKGWREVGSLWRAVEKELREIGWGGLS